MTNNLFVGNVYYRFDELPSTNDWASEFIAKSKPPEGMAVRADTQTAGRGQFGSRWLSPPQQNLLVSVVFYPDWLPVDEQFYLSMAAALALHDTVSDFIPSEKSTAPACSVKWPNDLYLADRKVAGMLIQNSLSGRHLQSAIVGIGLNINQLDFDPALPNPGSMASTLGRIFHLDEVMYRLFEHLEQRYLQLKSGQKAAIKSAYEARIYRKDLPTFFERLDDQSRFEGIIRGVAENGLLLVEADGLQTFDLKALRIV